MVLFGHCISTNQIPYLSINDDEYIIVLKNAIDDTKNPSSQYKLGVVYFNRTEFEVSYDLIMDYYKNQQLKDFIDARLQIGYMYHHKKDLEQVCTI